MRDSGATRVKELVTKLRTFSRLDEGTVKTVNIHESIESVLLFLGHKMEGRIDVERHYGDVEMITCFAGELNQVLMNVIANAIDAIEGLGRIYPERHRTAGRQRSFRECASATPAREYRRKSAIRVFRAPFSATKLPIGQGTGLGLAISYGIMRAHRGSMEFSTTLGEGPEFAPKIPTRARE